jgi:hypothetical protein
MQVIGSKLHPYFYRKSEDTDVIGTKAEFFDVVKACNNIRDIAIKEDSAYVKFISAGELLIIDWQFTDTGSPMSSNNAKLHDWMKRNGFSAGFSEATNQVVFVSHWQNGPQLYSALKSTHKYSFHKFEQNRKDIIWLNDIFNRYDIPIEIDDELSQIIAERTSITYKKTPRLQNMKKENFFTNNVKYVYDHDTIHAAVKLLDRPAYTYYMQDAAEVNCDKTKFYEQPEIVRLYGVLEESYVLALERSVIPFKSDPDKAFKMALQKVCTSITGGWFREYAWDNYDKVLELYHKSYVDKFNAALSKGEILAFKSEMK